MLTYNRDDFNLRHIVDRKMLELSANHQVYLYGLADKPGRPDIKITSMDGFGNPLLRALNSLARAGLFIEPRAYDMPDEEYDGIRIGINRRVREDIQFSKRVIMTLLAGIADRLKIDCTLKITRRDVAKAGVK